MDGGRWEGEEGKGWGGTVRGNGDGEKFPTIWILERHGLWYRNASNRIDRRSNRFRIISVLDDSPPDRTGGLPIA